MANNNGWLQKVLERIEDHILEQRRTNDRNERRWEAGERRWEANERRWEANERRWKDNHKLLLHVLSEIRALKKGR